MQYHYKLRHPELVEGSVHPARNLRGIFLFTTLLVTSAFQSHATTLWPELKAYDFARAYYLEDGGITLVPQDGFSCPDATETPEGLHITPGQTFTQFDPSRLIMEVYTFTRLDKDERRAWFHERRYRYKVVRTEANKLRLVPLNYLDSGDFFLTHWRALEWFDGAFPDIEIHSGEQLWRTRP
jgi:hypothetical protein